MQSYGSGANVSLKPFSLSRQLKDFEPLMVMLFVLKSLGCSVYATGYIFCHVIRQKVPAESKTRLDI